MKNNNSKKEKLLNFICIPLAILINTGIIYGAINSKKQSSSKAAKNLVVCDTTYDNKIILVKNNVVEFDNNSYESMPIKKTSRILNNINLELTDEVVQEISIPVETTSFTEETVDREKEVEIILEKYNLTRFEYESVVYVIFHEVYANNYDDAYRVINLIYNRTLSKRWVDYVNYVTGLDARSMYVQVICPGQFVVHNPNTDHFKLEDNFDTIRYQAIVDFLLSGERIHNYLSYRSKDSKIPGSVQFTSNGNVYFDVLTADDTIRDEQVKNCDNMKRPYMKKKVL